MARSSGFKINRHLHNFLRIVGVDFEALLLNNVTESQVIFEIRSIVGKYQPQETIFSDLQEIQAMEQSQEVPQEAEEVI